MLLCVAAVTIHGLTYELNTDDIPLKLKPNLSWTYWIAVTSGISTLITIIMCSYEAYLMSQRYIGYTAI